MPKTFPIQVRAFVLQRRREGLRWEEIRARVREELGVDPPPSPRQMRSWVKGTTPQAISRLMVGEMRRGLPPLVQREVVAWPHRLFPSMIAACLEGEDVGVVLAHFVLEDMEALLGTARIKRALDEYQKLLAARTGGVVRSPDKEDEKEADGRES